MIPIGTFLVGLAAPAVRKMIASLGVGIVSYIGVQTALTTALSEAKGAWAGLGGDALGLIELSGASTALSIIAGALTARLALIALKKLQVLA